MFFLTRETANPEEIMDKQPRRDELLKRLEALEQENLELRKRADQYKQEHDRVLGEIEESYYELDLKGNIVSFNNAAGSLLGYDPQEIPGMNYRKYTSPETAGRMYEIFHRIYETGNPEHVDNYVVIGKDGSAQNHEMSAWLRRNASGEPIGFNILIRDMTARIHSEMLLKKSEELYRTIFENTGNATILIAEDKTILLANSEFESLTGYTKKEMEGKISWTVVIAPEDLEKMIRYHAQRRMEGGAAPSSYESHIITRSNKIRDILFTIALIPGTKESVASCMDITDLKQAEAKARLNEARYRDILDSMEEAYYEVDLKGNFTFFNSKIVDRLGYTIDELSGLNYRQYMDEESALKVFDAYHRVFLTGEPVTDFSWEIKDRQGHPTFIEASISLRSDASGKPVGFRGVVRDVTQRKKMEDALRQSEERFRDLARLLPQTVFETNTGGDLIFVNEISLKQFGYTMEEFEKGINFLDVLAPEEHERAITNFNLSMMGESPGLSEYKARKKDGTIFPALIHSTPIYRDGVYAGIRGFLIDISDKKHMEKQLMRAQKLESIGTLAGGIAHDFNNLLMGILGNISLMLMHLDNAHPLY
ncbi:MAG TPA: PAS domain-containing sensor histidine kinase, partial [Deltaproteobacteria bacterium]|nr:PAS domain-containing sensor histidine kinase [Deltaproteobacteria bacterium]